LTHRRTHLTLALFGVAVTVALTGCGSARDAAITPSSKLVPATGNSPQQIVLTAQGAQRIGVQTAPALAAPGSRHGGPAVVIEPAAIVYDPSGRTYAFVNTAPLTFVEVPVAVDHISGNSAFLLKGPRTGAKVVTVGAEELLGVQTGVLAQS
jgi:hypothetical protein